jgi:hypothetical protein
VEKIVDCARKRSGKNPVSAGSFHKFSQFSKIRQDISKTYGDAPPSASYVMGLTSQSDDHRQVSTIPHENPLTTFGIARDKVCPLFGAGSEGKGCAL